jgi:AAA+ superfamily predicted ATPase
VSQLGDTLTVGESHFDDLLSALKHLNQLLDRAIATAEDAYGQEAVANPYRGLYISPEEVERILSREVGAPTLRPEEAPTEQAVPAAPAYNSRLAWLEQSFALSAFDMNVLLIALAPELDLRYERLYAYLQDDVTRRRPTVDLALNLLCTSAEDRLARGVHFAPDGPLVYHGLLHLVPDPHQLQPPLLSHYLKLDEQIIRFLLGRGGLDARLQPCCSIVEPATVLEGLPLPAEMKRALPALLIQAWEQQQPLRLHFHGPRGAGKRRTAEALAGETGVPLLLVDLARARTVCPDLGPLLQLILREAWFQGALLYLDRVDSLRDGQPSIQYDHLLDALAGDAGITVLAGEKPWVPPGRESVTVISVPFPIPQFAQRREYWRANLTYAGINLNGEGLDALAGRFRLTPGQIDEAVVSAGNRANWREACQGDRRSPAQSDGRPTLDDLFAAARAQSGHDLAALAHKIEPVYTWEDIVLPADILAHLREICQRVAHRHRVLGEWGFDSKLSLGKGITALFAGPSGTGKTMAAEIIANELGLDLYKIDLSGVVSKYIGETEKNLERIFGAAENANAILLFDEADALFGKRSEVRDSHDRYANIEISYLLQKMEEYEGIAILATNLRQNLDESFVRRLAFTVHFPFPDEDSRARIWAGVWPQTMPLVDDIDFHLLARQFKLSGGNIRNIALAAAFLAAEDGNMVTMAHVLHGTRREYQKMGKALSVGDFALIEA